MLSTQCVVFIHFNNSDASFQYVHINQDHKQRIRLDVSIDHKVVLGTCVRLTYSLQVTEVYI